jgi:hypothetical protein
MHCPCAYDKPGFAAPCQRLGVFGALWFHITHRPLRQTA